MIEHGAADGATFLAERLGQHGKVIHLQGDMGAPVAQLRSAGVHQVLDRLPSRLRSSIPIKGSGIARSRCRWCARCWPSIMIFAE